jgi:hypothetical protein
MVKYIIFFLCVLTLESPANMHRRARHFNARDAGASLVLDSRFITGLSDGDPVSTWSDRSGNGNNATSSGGARPLYVTTIQGGQPVVRFDSTDDGLIGNFNYSVTSQTVVMTIKMSSVTNFQRLYTQSDASFDYATANNYIPLLRQSGGNIAAYNNGTFYAGISTDSNWHIWSASHSGTTITNRRDGANPATGTATLSKTFTRYGMGFSLGDTPGAEAIGGDVGSLIVWTSDISGALRRRLEHAAALSFKIPCN